MPRAPRHQINRVTGEKLNMPFPAAGRDVPGSRVEKLPEAKRVRRMLGGERESLKASGFGSKEEAYRKERPRPPVGGRLGTVLGDTLQEIADRMRGK